MYFFIAEGRCSGQLAGRFRAANHPLRRADGTFLPDLQGVIDTDDGATIVLDMRGYGRTYPLGARQVVVAMTHVARHLHGDAVIPCEGEHLRVADRDPGDVLDGHGLLVIGLPCPDFLSAAPDVTTPRSFVLQRFDGRSGLELGA